MEFELNGINNFGFIDMGTGERFELSDASIEIEPLCPNEKPEIRSFGTCETSFICENATINE